MRALPDGVTAERLLTYISGARWFAGKGRRAELVSMAWLPWLGGPTDTPAVRFAVAEVAYPGEGEGSSTESGRTVGHEYYQLALSYRGAPVDGLHHAEVGRFADPDVGPAVVYDAMQDPQACRVVLEALLARRRVGSGDVEVRFELSAGEGLTADLEPHFYTGQQSNTSVMLGEVAMLKLFRRLELGRNLDIEVHDALGRAGIEDVAGLFGWVEGSWVQGDAPLDADLAMVVEKLADAADGWGLALDGLRAGRDFSAEAEALGRSLAETHAALRDAFPAAQVPGAETAAVMQARLDKALTAAPALEAYADGLRGCFDALVGTTLDTQRVHGDFHLGQTLHTPGGWKIIDFEGEPAKTMAERRAPDSAWRDIAGMLRSFDYAGASVPGPQTSGWVASAREAFLRGYAEGGLSPGDAATLRAYEADKAVYEVVYEVRNRPDWVAIPLGAVAVLADQNTKE